MNQIEVSNLYKIFGHHAKKALELSNDGMTKEEILEKTGNTIGVNDASFNVKQGETFVVMGLSGSGKSTLIRMLNRLIEPTYGQIKVKGEDIVQMDKERLRHLRRKQMGMVFQNFGLLPHRNVVRNVYYGLEIQGVDLETRRKKAYEVLELVGLKGYEESLPSELSGGMKQRVGLARALVSDPDILLMDEAFSALDPLIKKNMQDELIKLQMKMHKTVIFITHDLDEALKLGDRIAVMYNGKIVQIGTPEQILTNPENDYVRAFVENVDRSKVIKAESIMKKPLAVIESKEGPKAALRKMDKEEISSVFVTNSDGVLKGIITAIDAKELIDEGKRSIKTIIQDVPHTTSPDTIIVDLLPMATKAEYPIAVVDEQNHLLGVVVRVSVLAGIRGKREGDSNA
ncbi:MAG: glycine betaine/L-proline ABC transporter ATP-binding protein [Tenericutes bacterium]|nr:glycine betaine/L-proline ABC transporter ATP-binding protein [Mycoplasmatota bacterium]